MDVVLSSHGPSFVSIDCGVCKDKTVVGGRWLDMETELIFVVSSQLITCRCSKEASNIT